MCTYEANHIYPCAYAHLWAVLWQAARYGIGASSSDGVWYFAFGANMSPDKLSGSRGIQPLESSAARLSGWRLTFDHRCAVNRLLVPRLAMHA